MDLESGLEVNREEMGDVREIPSRKGSVYLDAVSDPTTDEDLGSGPGLNEILKELREIPDPHSTLPNRASHEDISHPQVDAGHSSNQDSSQLPALLMPVTSHPLSPITTAPTDTTIQTPLLSSRSTGHTKSRTLRHSFSSSTVQSRPIAPLLGMERDGEDDGQAEATVELHEESAAAFQDFLFWAYPHLECKVTWTNVGPVSTALLSMISILTDG